MFESRLASKLVVGISLNYFVNNPNSMAAKQQLFGFNIAFNIF
jgi:hypothetical protein